jgi:vrille protein
MSSLPFVLNNHPYHDTSSSSSSCSSLDIFPEEYLSLTKKSSRKQCASIPDKKKDPIYWSQRSKNNLSAQRSRVKRRMNDLVLETKLTQLSNENEILRAKIEMLTRKFGQENEQLKPTILNILDQSSIQTNHSAIDPSMITTEQLALNKSSIPIKLRFKLLNITSDS